MNSLSKYVVYSLIVTCFPFLEELDFNAKSFISAAAEGSKYPVTISVFILL